MRIHSFLIALTLLVAGWTTEAAAPKPNFIIIFCDDLGYADIGPFGSKTHTTPVLDRMAKEGLRLTDFYSSCSVCTPSRASLMTGCYPRRVNMHEDEHHLCVLFPAARKGLNPSEITIAEILKQQGYATMCIGKWHLGDHPNFLPTRQGFDAYFGIPYSNDMNRKKVPLPLLRNETVIADGVQKDTTITAQYTTEAVRFIRAHAHRRFFLYLAHTAVHAPHTPGKAFQGTSQDGPYGDWVQEIDWSTGEILKTLRAEGLDKNTLVLFTSDNGSTREKQGSNLPLRGRKGRTDEGGMREPCVVWWPGHIPAGASRGEVTGTIDILPTFAALAGGQAPKDRIIDGANIWPILSGAPQAISPHEAYFYYQMDQLQAVRSGPWKMFVPMESKKRNWGKPEGKTELKLFNLAKDIHEDHNVAAAHPDVVAKLMRYVEQARADLGDGDRPGQGQRPAGWVDQPSPRLLKSAAASTKPHPSARWESAIAAFEQQDRQRPPAKNGILFVGSSSIRKWTTLADDFAGYPVIRRGFGGSQLADSIYYYRRLIQPYAPKTVVVYAGDNDIAAGKSPQVVFRDFQELVRLIQTDFSQTRVLYIAIKASTARWKLRKPITEANELIRQYCARQPKLEFIDVYHPMLGPDGRPRAELLVQDGLHLSRAGYQLWTKLVRAKLGSAP